MIDFCLSFGLFLDPKLLQNGFQSGFGKTLSEDVVLNLQKDGSGEGGVESGEGGVELVPPPLKLTCLGSLWGNLQEGD